MKPHLSDRDIGWLRYLYRKATTPDSWDRDGQPHEHWDNRSDPPAASWHRFDLTEATYAIAMMADVTPAWREVYGRILDELIFRHTGWWAAADWLTQIGHDPARAEYPDLYRMLIPPQLWGKYDVPGWTANGIAPWGLQLDPIAAEGYLFFKGFFLVMLGLHLRTTGDERWNKPFDMIRDGPNTFTWFHSAIAELLHKQWRAAPYGCHCENTKVWPTCLAAAGLGLQLHDLLRGTDYHAAFRQWYDDVCHTQYLRLHTESLPTHVTMYYDPPLDVHHEVRLNGRIAPTAVYFLPQVPASAHRLMQPEWERIAQWRPGAGSLLANGMRASAATLWLAREWGMEEPAGQLAAAIDAEYEPTFDPATGEFAWHLGLNEKHPRGQYNGSLAAAEIATPGAWQRLFTTSPGNRFDEPTVIGVDFPQVALREAKWDPQRQRLSVRAVGIGTQSGRTTFRVVNIGAPSDWFIAEPEQAPGVSMRIVGAALEIETMPDDRPITLARRAG